MHWIFRLKDQILNFARSLNLIHAGTKKEGKRQPSSYKGLDPTTKQPDHQPPHEAAWKKDLVMIAKNANVWLVQLSTKYKRSIEHLDQIPDEELKKLAARGITSLWLIGVWERSPASKKIKELYGRKDVTASAYSIKDYCIADQLGGEDAASAFKASCKKHGIRLCVDMVPNHTGIDSTWLLEHPDWYITVPKNPLKSFHFNSPDLSPTPNLSIKLEEGYYTQTATAEVFLYEDHQTGKKQFIYHGNDGTSMPWNDTAQLNYLDKRVREQVMNTILSILKRFPLIRFDAAMTLSSKQFQRLWYPLPNSKERCIPTREKNALSAQNFLRHMPHEFWLEVVERVEQENPDALLMAEAFWYMENYFIHELGMHRVYNSAFMHSLYDEDNKNYQKIMKIALETNPDILGRFVNFMSNPDERTAADLFGKGDKYFAVCTLLATMPGIPMFNHGQIEGFEERYGMDFLAPLMEENEDEALICHHEKWIFPLLRMRPCFSNAGTFRLFEVLNKRGHPLPQVYAFMNQHQDRHFLVLVNNSSKKLHAQFQHTVPTAVEPGQPRTLTLFELLPASPLEQALLHCHEIRTGESWTFHKQELEKVGLTFDLKPYQHFVCELTWNEEQADSAPISR
ncbi:MAG: alpha-amylase family glycosyl hydrolase [Anaerolineaceae bacterium]